MHFSRQKKNTPKLLCAHFSQNALTLKPGYFELVRVTQLPQKKIEKFEVTASIPID